ncbi:hypothetical protein GGX14DRAFT_637121 [Mycena pura]|uniref:Uncharacterized protein n=1 Tax=Mycena pura TaxID=153505 RepID=A0AAD6VBZ3_9AGAR|nr:hypothetical protein GGX14DRAFT_637121 [Mycena pura]
MSSKREKALEERLKKLETTLRGTQAKLVDRDNEIGTSGGPFLIPSIALLTCSAARLTTSGGKPALIQKPDGQAGRNFNLAAALEDGVGMDKKTYRKYYALIVFYIMELFSVCGTLSQHSEAKVKAVVAAIQKRLPIFQRFQDGWPIRAVFAQLLRNYHERRKRLERSLKVPLTQCGRNKKRIRSGSAIDAEDAPANSEDEFAADGQADDPEDDADDLFNNDHVEIEFDYSDLKAIDTTVNEGEGVASSSKTTLEDMPKKVQFLFIRIPVDKGKARARDTVSVSRLLHAAGGAMLSLNGCVKEGRLRCSASLRSLTSAQPTTAWAQYHWAPGCIYADICAWIYRRIPSQAASWRPCCRLAQAVLLLAQYEASAHPAYHPDRLAP